MSYYVLSSINFLYSRNIIGKKWDYARGDLLSSLTMPQGGACQWFSSGAAKAAHQSSGSFPQDDMLRRSAVALEFTVAPKKKDDAGGRLIIIFHYFSKIKFPVQIIAISGPFTLCASIHIIVYIWKLLGVFQCYQRNYYIYRVNNSLVFPPFLLISTFSSLI